jgi:hypothetical protein
MPSCGLGFLIYLMPRGAAAEQATRRHSGARASANPESRAMILEIPGSRVSLAPEMTLWGCGFMATASPDG